MFNRRKILHYLLLPVIPVLGLAAGLSSCSDDDSPAADRMVSVTLTLSTGTPGTRAYTQGTEEGTADENYIDMDNLQVLIYSATEDVSGYIGEIYFNSTERVDDNTYRLSGVVNESVVPTGDFRIIIAANWPGGKGSIANWIKSGGYGDNLIQLFVRKTGQYSYSGTADSPYIPSPTSPMPMYGVRTFSAGTIAKTPLEIDLGTIKVIRAMAKVVVRCTSGDVLSDVKLTRCNSSGHTAPFGVYWDTEDFSNSNINQPRLWSTMGDVGAMSVIENLPFREVANTELNVTDFVICIPEYINISGWYNGGKSQFSSAVPSQIAIKLNGKDYTLDFKNYDNDREFNIVRNTVYIYDVCAGNPVNISYVVEPWDSEVSGDVTFD
jgi:hypothetical protein